MSPSESDPDSDVSLVAEIERLRRRLDRERSARREAERIADNWAPNYHFDEGVLTDADVTVTAESIAFAGQTIALNGEVPEGWQVD